MQNGQWCKGPKADGNGGRWWGSASNPQGPCCETGHQQMVGSAADVAGLQADAMHLQRGPDLPQQAEHFWAAAGQVGEDVDDSLVVLMQLDLLVGQLGGEGLQG